MAEEIYNIILSVLPDLLKAIVSLFIVVDPLGNIPTFISLMSGMDSVERRKAIRTASLVGLILLLAFTIAGEQILHILGISLYGFMVAGGVLLFIMAIRILLFGGLKEETTQPESIGVVPIACPLLVGPGAITTTIVSLKTIGIIITLATVLITFGIVWLILRFIEPIHRLLGKTGALIVERIMAMFIAALATGYIIEGVKYF